MTTGCGDARLMDALTIWQPWASLVMIGAKGLEFRKWDYRCRRPDLVGKRIVVHAGAREVRMAEVRDIVERIEAGSQALAPALAMPLLKEIILAAPKGRGVVELAAGLGTAVLGKPFFIDAPFSSPADGNRIEGGRWAWPLTDVIQFPVPVRMRGRQGFWKWRER